MIRVFVGPVCAGCGKDQLSVSSFGLRFVGHSPIFTSPRKHGPGFFLSHSNHSDRCSRYLNPSRACFTDLSHARASRVKHPAPEQHGCCRRPSNLLLSGLHDAITVEDGNSRNSWIQKPLSPSVVLGRKGLFGNLRNSSLCTSTTAVKLVKSLAISAPTQL